MSRLGSRLTLWPFTLLATLSVTRRCVLQMFSLRRRLWTIASGRAWRINYHCCLVWRRHMRVNAVKVRILSLVVRLETYLASPMIICELDLNDHLRFS